MAMRTVKSEQTRPEMGGEANDGMAHLAALSALGLLAVELVP